MELADLSPLQVVLVVVVLCLVLICIVALVLLAFAPAGTLQAALPVFLFMPPTVAAILSLAKLGSVQQRAEQQHADMRGDLADKDRRLQEAEARLERLEQSRTDR